ncbi:MAG: phenylalanine--tRNA ligase subunit alpha [Eubacteriaceae bacterium]
MIKQLNTIKDETLQKIIKAENLSELEDIRVSVLGKKGNLTNILRSMNTLSAEERPVIGATANIVKESIELSLANKKEEIVNKAMQAKLDGEYIDITLPGNKVDIGSVHPISKTAIELVEIFASIGFSVAEGPEIDFTKYNFDYLNTPSNHPARSLTDTFYINEDVLLRTQTSPVQIRTMLSNKPPIKVISPGKVYRCDEIDATHSPLFNQMEGIIVDKDITMSDLKGTLEFFAKQLFGPQTKTKFRHHQFYFTEPGAEMDATCPKCKGLGCRVCGNTGWIEILGCGMLHPNIMEICGISHLEYSGYAFGMGIDRIAMIKYGLEDLRLVYENDIRFIQQFIGR